MLLESFLESLSIDGKSMLFSQFFCQLDWEAIGIIKLKCDAAADYSALSFKEVWKKLLKLFLAVNKCL